MIHKFAQCVKGWEAGVKCMSLGEKARLYVPARYGYGGRGFHDDYMTKYLVPPNADIMFEIKILAVNGQTARN